MDAYEKLGVFYLGREYDLEQKRIGQGLVLYDSKDLCTHGVIVGMTGSGKTGLGISLLEEALIDQIPVIAVDPKGDLTNLLLTFPDLKPEDFQPYVNPQAAAAAGRTIGQYAQNQAKLWAKGLADWDQGPERIARLKAAAEVTVYTPGSAAGQPVNVLRSFNPPPGTMGDDPDAWREKIRNTTSSLLALLGVDADPLTSREHILISNIFQHYWSAALPLDLAGIIHAIQNPPFERIGVMAADSFYPAKERFGLAMKLNGLLASPGFSVWLEGEPLDFGRFLQARDGRPKASIFTISHLDDSERMFFLSMLLSEALSWMRSQPGTSSLRALLYIDEIFGFFPPVSNPPSKEPLLTLLKQARAFGLGVVLSTQNPVDLDYKGLSNAGTWFVGRLQAERDKERLLAGLEGLEAGRAYDRARLDGIISSLDKRVFLLHNVHETRPQVFHTRWALSYLPGPLTREQIRSLNRGAGSAETAQAFPRSDRGTEFYPLASGVQVKPTMDDRPVLPPEITAYYMPASGAGQGVVYYPAVAAGFNIYYASAKHNLSMNKASALACLIEDGPATLDWDQAMPIEVPLSSLVKTPIAGARHGELPRAAARPEFYKKWQSEAVRWVRQNQPITLFNSSLFKLTSRPGEPEGQFRARLSQSAREMRDLEAEKLRNKYASKFASLQERIRRAEQAVEREQEQAQAKKIDTVVSFGAAILGAFLGRKAVGSGSVGRMGTAIKTAGRTKKEMQDVARAQETAEAAKAQLAELEARFQEDLSSLTGMQDGAAEQFEEIRIAPKSTDIAVEFFGLVWLPYRVDVAGHPTKDWA